MQVCISLQTDNHASTHHSVFTGRMTFLPPNQQRQSTEGLTSVHQAAKLLAALLKVVGVTAGLAESNGSLRYDTIRYEMLY